MEAQGRPVKFTATHTRGFAGSDIAVTVSAGEKETIASVTVSLDGSDLEELELADGTESYARTFANVGANEPGMRHTLIVTATDAGGVPHSATTEWSD